MCFHLCLCVCFHRENLERLLDDKHFKEEIVHFNISEETEVVDASHRAKLIPLLMRYLCVCADYVFVSFLKGAEFEIQVTADNATASSRKCNTHQKFKYTKYFNNVPQLYQK